MTEATEKDLKDLVAPDGAVPLRGDGVLPLFERVRAFLWKAFFDRERIAELELYAIMARLDAATGRPPTAIPTESPTNPSDLASSLTREREENQRLTRALRAAWDELRGELCANCDHAFSEQDYADEDCASAHHAMELVRTALLTSGASAPKAPSSPSGDTE